MELTEIIRQQFSIYALNIYNTYSLYKFLYR